MKRLAVLFLAVFMSGCSMFQINEGAERIAQQAQPTATVIVDSMDKVGPAIDAIQSVTGKQVTGTPSAEGVAQKADTVKSVADKVSSVAGIVAAIPGPQQPISGAVAAVAAAVAGIAGAFGALARRKANQATSTLTTVVRAVESLPSATGDAVKSAVGVAADLSGTASLVKAQISAIKGG